MPDFLQGYVWVKGRRKDGERAVGGGGAWERIISIPPLIRYVGRKESVKD